MKKMVTSAAANKILRELEEEKTYWRNVEISSCTYKAALNEEPVVPEYDYTEVSGVIAEIDRKVRKIKHALNVHNALAAIPVDEEILSVDEILIRMAQLTNRKSFLDTLRKKQHKTRIAVSTFRNPSPEYEYTNYDMYEVKTDYKKAADQLTNLQMALDRFNQTVEFEISV